MTKNDDNLMDKIISLAKRRGFIFPGSEIYGGLANSYDYGPLGTELFNNIRNLWWKKMVQQRSDMVGIRGPIIMNPKVWEASGHISSFTDPLVECKICHIRMRADKPADIKTHEETHKGKTVEWTEPKNFNLLFKTFIGTTEDSKATVYLRGETAQTMFTDFKLVLETMRRKLPFGIAQIGRSFRNEITTGNSIFRMKEFTIAELEYFVKPGEDDAAFEDWLNYQQEFFIQDLKLKKENIKTVELPKDELAHYSKRTVDTYYKFPFGWDEIAGHANRTDYDLKNQIALSGANLKYKDQTTGEEFVPFVIEPTFGMDRMMLAVLIDAYSESEARSGKEDAVHETEVTLRLPKELAPIKIAVLPLSKKEPLTAQAVETLKILQKLWMCQYDETGSIGKRYRRQDEIGTLYCVTVDFETANDQAVTVRDRDTMAQERVKIAELVDYFKEKLGC
ncbi:MAG: glycine--tRNA ligase [Candidatus Doudnabacteria bacterium RIFCSPLOWO2_02_FULL_49_13]|uniref:glycine--tRNA ligase n=1 Tax=Candidatus Doudnabacteria bacterium RIFCSPHIGHO2_12_FULL_48_16 TaxID=1817838 RepID=A0A1F5PJU7_9BACT|nr:MAG: glycine--tRNA ligase [Candidatus Doudnabacteria bacterium RIFCSPHIGHO2_02_FULL_49_24]OGE90074.1 MAG: glycine--tRNA ligase [Candidatus Doudnabacteria bacterium RIFCSPHIGHO2_12_FULL_48_16]OGE90442.1 MAG: glycine--tRNA ligase [Candidatus Doudnabacteria bacterium RIFCSPHIGHO2_01_FULL_50_67]OGE96498.1 MAG: glycine--tRNA ligase [Candidatus Doudnabacteria bacterium RIFCSPLOWO2_01_FULL_49_40]OGF03217.1 MAG: glycine--tRNA ligase [Candidatus Doudnabacteria bacterium RIFCSPLOWO2_02_FULL_49_13]